MMEGKLKGRLIWLMYFLYMYKYGKLKFVEVILRREVGEEGEQWSR
jgi:hypothetical protein